MEQEKLYKTEKEEQLEKEIAIKDLKIMNLESQIKKLKKENQEFRKSASTFRKEIKQLREEIDSFKIKYDRLKNQKGRNPLGSGRKSMDDMWRAKIEDCWKAGMKDKEIYGWITCTDDKGRFHVLSESTYYRFKRKYYETFKNDFDRESNE